jgi:hypothetical protein
MTLAVERLQRLARTIVCLLTVFGVCTSLGGDAQPSYKDQTLEQWVILLTHAHREAPEVQDALAHMGATFGSF